MVNNRKALRQSPSGNEKLIGLSWHKRQSDTRTNNLATTQGIANSLWTINNSLI